MSREIFRSENGCVRVTAFAGETRGDGGHPGRLQVDADRLFPINTLSVEQAIELHQAIGQWLADLAKFDGDLAVAYGTLYPDRHRHADLMRSAVRICENNMQVLHVDRVTHPEGCTFSHFGGRSITVHGKDNDRRVLEFMVSEQVRPDSGMVLPPHELLERAATVFMEEAQLMFSAMKKKG